MEITIAQRILNANDEITARNRELLKAHDILTINLMGSPGAGKTSLLENIIAKLKTKIRLAVIEGDLYTRKDAERIESHGIPVIQINTRGACHLDGNMIQDALEKLPLNDIQLLVIENIGNLVCPAEFDLGEDRRISILSVTEGEDKVAKYPLMFKETDAVILNKVDLLPYTNFDTDVFYQDVRSLNPAGEIFEISCADGRGIDSLAEWLQKNLKK